MTPRAVFIVFLLGWTATGFAGGTAGTGESDGYEARLERAGKRLLGDGARILEYGQRINDLRAQIGMKPVPTVEIGDSKHDALSKVMLDVVAFDTLLKCGSLSLAVRHLASADTLVWRGGETNVDGIPVYYIGVFARADGESEPRMNDLLKLTSGDLRPLRVGAYSHALRKLTEGMSMEDVYSELGEKRPSRYWLDKGTWKLQFCIQGLNDEHVYLNVQPRTGVVTKVFRARF